MTVLTTEKASLKIEKTARFEEGVKHFAAMLSEIDVVTLELQKRGAKLADCRCAFEILTQAVATGLQDVESNLYGCR